MNISGSPVGLDRFLEVKRAAERRMSVSPAAKPVFTAAPAKAPAVRASAAADGLLSVYGLNRALSSRFSESGSAETVVNNRHLGALFDKTA